MEDVDKADRILTGKMTYAIAEMKGEDQLRNFLFVKWDENDGVLTYRKINNPLPLTFKTPARLGA